MHCSIAPATDARTTKIQILSRGIAFGGFSFPGVGQYERIVGTGFGELSPANPHNTPIVDLSLAPRNSNGHVPYLHDSYILKPLRCFGIRRLLDATYPYMCDARVAFRDYWPTPMSDNVLRTHY